MQVSILKSKRQSHNFDYSKRSPAQKNTIKGSYTTSLFKMTYIQLSYSYHSKILDIPSPPLFQTFPMSLHQILNWNARIHNLPSCHIQAHNWDSTPHDSHLTRYIEISKQNSFDSICNKILNLILTVLQLAVIPRSSEIFLKTCPTIHGFSFELVHVYMLLLIIFYKNICLRPSRTV